MMQRMLLTWNRPHSPHISTTLPWAIAALATFGWHRCAATDAPPEIEAAKHSSVGLDVGHVVYGEMGAPQFKAQLAMQNRLRLHARPETIEDMRFSVVQALVDWHQLLGDGAVQPEEVMCYVGVLHFSLAPPAEKQETYCTSTTARGSAVTIQLSIAKLIESGAPRGPNGMGSEEAIKRILDDLNITNWSASEARNYLYRHNEIHRSRVEGIFDQDEAIVRIQAQDKGKAPGVLRQLFYHQERQELFTLHVNQKEATPGWTLRRVHTSQSVQGAANDLSEATFTVFEDQSDSAWCTPKKAVCWRALLQSTPTTLDRSTLTDAEAKWRCWPPQEHGGGDDGEPVVPFVPRKNPNKVIPLFPQRERQAS